MDNIRAELNTGARLNANLGCGGHALQLGSLVCQFLCYPLSLLVCFVRHFGPGREKGTLKPGCLRTSRRPYNNSPE